MKKCDIAIIGGGMVGASLGYGLARAGKEVAILDKGDRDFRAARGNFGLLWVQGKGAEFPEYAKWTQFSAQQWPELAQELKEVTGVDVCLQQKGGIHYCLTEQEFMEYEIELKQQANLSNGQFEFQMLRNKQLLALEPHISPTIYGGAYSPNDGHVNPLLLLRALHIGFQRKGGEYCPRHGVNRITPTENGFHLDTDAGQYITNKVILAAGLENKRLAPMIGLAQPLTPQRGQLLITERLPKLLNYPSIYLRQTGEGSIQIGDSHENSGLDDSNTSSVMATLAKRAVDLLPELKHTHIVRGWGALRVMSPDGYPIYDEAPAYPGKAFAFSCHSAVTLAAAHALCLATMLLDGTITSNLNTFSSTRFPE
ncbi:MAG: NAD(P)/FAD-dependent oxidoreductase [Marinomonadaceae bacterium]